MINLTFFLVPIIIIVIVMVIEFWLRRKRQKSAGTTQDKEYIAVRLCSGVGGFAAIWVLYFLLVGLLEFFLGSFASRTVSELKKLFLSPIGIIQQPVVSGTATVGGLCFAFFDRRFERAKLPPWLKYPLISALGVMGGCFALLLHCGVVRVGLPLSERAIYSNFPQIYTYPLEASVVAHLCDTLQLAPADQRCQSQAVYTLDFFPDIARRYSKKDMPREQVDQEIGAYLVGCSEWVATTSDGAFQTCCYRFLNDRACVSITYQQGYDPIYSPRLPQGNSGGQVWGVVDLDP
jgi:hypothetical protein